MGSSRKDFVRTLALNALGAGTGADTEPTTEPITEPDKTVSKPVTNEEPNEPEPVEKETKNSDKKPIKQAVIPADLNIRQYIVLKEIYFNRPYAASGKGRICPEIPRETVRGCVTALKRKGYIRSAYRISGPNGGQSTARVHDRRCLELFGPTPIKNPPKDPLKTLLEKYL